MTATILWVSDTLYTNSKNWDNIWGTIATLLSQGYPEISSVTQSSYILKLAFRFYILILI